MSRKVSALFVRRDSVYKTLDGVDCWDEDRDARNCATGLPVVAHPPRRMWGRLRQFAKGQPHEKNLARLAVSAIRAWGGVLEHPASSTLWGDRGLPKPGESFDQYGGYSAEVDQWHWGHKARKSTWLYIVGVSPDNLPSVPKREGRPTHVVRTAKVGSNLKVITKKEREATPLEFAKWLVELARRVKV